jgi:hypothetical protein
MADDPPIVKDVGAAEILSTSHGLYVTPLLTNPETLLFVPHQLSVAIRPIGIPDVDACAVNDEGVQGVPVGLGCPTPTTTTAVLVLVLSLISRENPIEPPDVITAPPTPSVPTPQLVMEVEFIMRYCAAIAPPSPFTLLQLVKVDELITALPNGMSTGVLDSVSPSE